MAAYCVWGETIEGTKRSRLKGTFWISVNVIGDVYRVVFPFILFGWGSSGVWPTVQKKSVDVTERGD